MPFDSSNKKYQFQKAVAQQEFQGFKPNFHKETHFTAMMRLYHGIPKLFSPSPLLILHLLKSQCLWHNIKLRCFNFRLNRYIPCTTGLGRTPGFLPSLRAQGSYPPALPQPGLEPDEARHRRV